MQRRSFLAGGGALAVLAFRPWEALAAGPGGAPAIGSFGLDLGTRDLSVRPGDDFFAYVNGAWLATAKIPDDKPRWGTFDELREAAQNNVRALVEELLTSDAPAGTPEQKIADFYRSFLDTDAIERAGLGPVAGDLAAIAAIADHAAVARLIATPELPLDGPIGFGLTIDEDDPDRWTVVVGQGGLHLPDRDYYLQDDPRMAELREKFRVHVARLLSLAGQPEPEAKAAAVLALETAFAERHQPIEDLRDSTKMHNPRSRAELVALAPMYPWDAAFEAAGFSDVDRFVPGPLAALARLGEHFPTTDLEAWKAYFTYSLLRSWAKVLPKAFDDEVFDFYGRTLDGQPAQRERAKRATDALDGALGHALGQLYVRKHFSENAKALVVDLVENLRKAFAERIEGLPWMSAETKAVAREKLATFRLKVGYPDTWRDYSAFEVRRGDPVGNQRRLARYTWDFDRARLDRPSDRDEWFMAPQTVNAYYNPPYNEIVFPAAILQPPFFDEHADPAVNYGGIGGVIGHEMGHGFDDQGSKYDPKGVLRTWWNERDVEAFVALGERMVAQYDRFEALPGVHVNGRLTLGENIGDHCGVVVGLHAWRLSLRGKRAPKLDGLTGEQRFFLSWGRIWRSLFRDEALRNHVETNVHSPGRFRCNGAVQNVDEWFEAFRVRPGDALWVPPEERIRLW